MNQAIMIKSNYWSSGKKWKRSMSSGRARSGIRFSFMEFSWSFSGSKIGSVYGGFGGSRNEDRRWSESQPRK